MRIKLLVSCGILMFALSNGAASEVSDTPQVILADGVLAGTFSGDAPGGVFKGVPFAKPPIGALRWHEPVPLKPWQGIKKAEFYGPACTQIGRSGPGSEDCLYLNIWTPEWPISSQRPVMLWLFGGANQVNSASNPQFDGAALAAKGVVVVTTNHRVGAMGFMAHPALSAESEQNSSGNYALLDQIMALRWIQENIAQFGGDPEQVTLFGQSSGSYDLLLLMTSPLAEGLFHKAIAQAGQLLSFGGTMPKLRAEVIGVSIAAELDIPEGMDALEYMRGLPAEEVVAAAQKWLPTDLASDTGLLTNVDGWVLPELPARVFAEGRQMAIPLIVGNNAREIPMDIAPDKLREQIIATYAEFAPQALEAYGLSNGGEGYVDPLLGGPGPQWMTDTVQRCAAIMEANWHAAANNSTWQYQFERSISGKEDRGAFHGADVPFVFGTFDVSDEPYTEQDRKASEQMGTYWTNFAKTGDPNGDQLPIWPRAGESHYMAFTMDGSVAKQNLQPKPCGIFQEWVLQKLEK